MILGTACGVRVPPLRTIAFLAGHIDARPVAIHSYLDSKHSLALGPHPSDAFLAPVLSILIYPPQPSWPPNPIHLPWLSDLPLELSEVPACAVVDGMSEMRHTVDEQGLKRCR